MLTQLVLQNITLENNTVNSIKPMVPKEQVSSLKVPDKTLQLSQWSSVIDYQGHWIHFPQLGKFRAIERNRIPVITQETEAPQGKAWQAFLPSADNDPQSGPA